MKMHIRRVEVVSREAFAARGAEPFPPRCPEVRAFAFGQPLRVMEFMAAKLRAVRAGEAGANAVAEMIEPLGHFHSAGNRTCHRISLAVERDQFFGE